VSAIAGLVEAGLKITNAVIDLGQQAYRIVGKYVGRALGYLAGGAAGALTGDVRFLLNRTTGELLAYSSETPEDKRSHKVPTWMRGLYGEHQPVAQQNQLNIYAGPGQTTGQMMNDAMWLVNVGGSGIGASQGAMAESNF